MTKILNYLMILVFAVTLASCGDDDEPKSNHPLEGEWVCVEATDPLDVGVVFVFNKDGSGANIEESRTDRFTDYEVKDGMLKIWWEGNDYWDELGQVSINSDTFILNLGEYLMIFKKK